MRNPENSYMKRKEHYERLSNKFQKTSKNITNLRLGVFLVALILISIFLWMKNHFVLIGIVAVFLYIFINLIIKHYKVTKFQKYMTVLMDINKQSIERIKGQWHSFSDTGEEFMNEDHAYSHDLDIFGKGSIFQWINSTKTYMGRINLKNILESPHKDVKEIIKRQEAIKELEKNLPWRQRLMAEGMIIPKKLLHPDILMKWAEEEISFYTKTGVIVLVTALPIVTVLLGIGAIIVPIIPFYLPLTLLVIQGLLLIGGSKRRNDVLDKVQKYKDNIKAYEYMLKTIEKKKFKSIYLQDKKSYLHNEKGLSASQQVKRLSKITDMISNRFNMFYLIINVIILWDYQAMIALEDWKKNSGKELRMWLNIIGEMEALSSVAVIGQDNPEWVMPEVLEKQFMLLSKDLGHPLLGEERVVNDLNIEKPASILLITGSNMSGKSTLLRTTGINLVLAYTGARVCAREFKCSIMDIYSCMRVSDDLENNISSFYAELLRIKEILKIAKEERQIFFLLDEIFKGTNSEDRHTGAKTLIKELSKHKTLGMVSTHDLELSELENEMAGAIKNYHFEEYYHQNEIKFDYILRKGVSTTRNALYLMKMIGMDINE